MSSRTEADALAHMQMEIRAKLPKCCHFAFGSLMFFFSQAESGGNVWL